MVRLRKGNNGEIRQNGRLIVEIGHWHLQDGRFMRAEFLRPIFEPDNEDGRMRVILRNGDAVELDTESYIAAWISPCSDIIRGRLTRWPRLVRQG